MTAFIIKWLAEPEIQSRISENAWKHFSLESVLKHTAVWNLSHVMTKSFYGQMQNTHAQNRPDICPVCSGLAYFP